MPFSKDRLHELEIACAILKTNIHKLSFEWDCSDNWIRMVARGDGPSERIENKIEQFIKTAQKTVPFSYPTNEQTNEQNEKTHNLQLKSA